MEKGRFAAVWEMFPVGTQSTTPGNVLTKHLLSGLERVKPEVGDPGGRRLTGETPPSSGRAVGSRGESLHMFQTESQAELDQWLAGVGGRRALQASSLGLCDWPRGRRKVGGRVAVAASWRTG